MADENEEERGFVQNVTDAAISGLGAVPSFLAAPVELAASVSDFAFDKAVEKGYLQERMGDSVSEGVQKIKSAIQKETLDLITVPLKQASPEKTKEFIAKNFKPGTGEQIETGSVGEIVGDIGSMIGQGVLIYRQLPAGLNTLSKVFLSEAAITQIDKPLGENENLFNVAQKQFGDSIGEGTVSDILRVMSGHTEDSELTARLKAAGEGLSIVALSEFLSKGSEVTGVTGKVKGAFVIASAGLIEVSKKVFNKSPNQLTPEERGLIFVDAIAQAKLKVDEDPLAAARRMESLDRTRDGSPLEFEETPQEVQDVLNNSKSGFFKRNFKKGLALSFGSKGYFSQSGFDLWNHSQFNIRATVQHAEDVAMRLQASLDDITRTAEKKEVVQAVQKALGDDLEFLRGQDYEGSLNDLVDIYGIPKEVGKEVIEARNLIDQMSLKLTHSKNVPDALKETIMEGIGGYIRRSYKIFEDGSYTPTPAVYNDAVDYLENQYLSKNIVVSKTSTIEYTPEQRRIARAKAEDDVNGILNSADQKEAFDWITVASKVNKNILKRKNQEIPEEIRALMGEIKEPSDNIVLTVTKMARLYENSRFFSNLDKLGNGKYIFDEGAVRPEGVNWVQIGSTGKTNTNLDGKWTTPEMLKAMQNQQGSLFNARLKDGNPYKHFLFWKGQSQKNKTVYSHVTHARNFIGGMQFGAANGIYPFKDGGKSFQILKDKVGTLGDIEFEETYREYQRLGIINTNTKIGEFRELLETGYQTQSGNLSEGIGDLADVGLKATTGGKLTRKRIEDTYVATDDFFKINAYHSELDTLKRAYPDEKEAVLKAQASRIVQNTFPNYDRVVPMIRKTKDLPFGSFVSFPAEITRTSYNIIKQGYKEITSGNPELAARGRARLAGYTVTTFGWEAAATASALKLGLTPEQKEAVDVMTETPWSSTAPRLVEVIDGQMYSLDTQFLDSYSAVKVPFQTVINKILQGQVKGEEFDSLMLEATAAGLKELTKPYFEESILTTAISDVVYAASNPKGRTPTGKLLFDPDNPQDSFQNVGYVFLDSMMPGSLTSLIDLNDAYNEVPQKTTGKTKNFFTELVKNMTGIGYVKVDPETLMKRAVSTYKYNKTKPYAINYKNSYDEVLQQYDRSLQADLKEQRELFRKIQAAKIVYKSFGTDQLKNKFEIDALFLHDTLVNEGKGLGSSAAYMLLEGNFNPPPVGHPVSVSNAANKKMKFPKGKDGYTLETDLNSLRNKYLNNRLYAPKEDTKGFKTGGEVNVPNAPKEPDERINKLTGLPYNETAGLAYQDKEGDPLARLGFGRGGYAEGGLEDKIASLLGISEENIKWVKSIDKNYGEDERYDGKGDAARHLALGWATAQSGTPDLALLAANAREIVDTGGRTMDVHNNKLGSAIQASSIQEAEKEIQRLIQSKEAMFMSPEESYNRRGYSKAGVIKKIFFAPKKESGLFSKAEKEAGNLEQKEGTGDVMLKKLSDKGVTKEELEFTGADEQFKGNPKVTREELLGFFRKKDFDLQDYIGKENISSFGGGDPKIFQAQYQEEVLEGNSGYKELLVSLPKQHKKIGTKDYNESHWSQPNVIVHARVSTVKPKDNKKNKHIMMIDEIQSDFHQDSKEKKAPRPEKVILLTLKKYLRELEYTNKRIELFKKRDPEITKYFFDDSTRISFDEFDELSEKQQNIFEELEDMTSDVEAYEYNINMLNDELHVAKGGTSTAPDLPFRNEKKWALLGLKKAMINAATEGYDTVALSTYEMQYKKTRNPRLKSFYDKTLVKLLDSNFAKKYNVNIKQENVNIIDENGIQSSYKVPTLEITDKMREDILKGLPMFSEGGSVDEENNIKYNTGGKVYNSLKRNCS